MGSEDFMHGLRAQVKVLAVYCDENKVRCAGPGESLRVRLSGIEEEDILSGFILSSVGKFFSMVSQWSSSLTFTILFSNSTCLSFILIVNCISFALFSGFNVCFSCLQ